MREIYMIVKSQRTNLSLCEFLLINFEIKFSFRGRFCKNNLLIYFSFLKMKQRVHGYFGTIERKKLCFMYRIIFKYTIDGK